MWHEHCCNSFSQLPKPQLFKALETTSHRVLNLHLACHWAVTQFPCQIALNLTDLQKLRRVTHSWNWAALSNLCHLLPLSTKGYFEKLTWLIGVEEVQVSYKSLHAVLTQNHRCFLMRWNDRKDCSSCHGELFSEIVSFTLLSPEKMEIFLEFFFPFSLVPAPASRPRWPKIWCYLLILKIHEDKLVSFLPCSLCLKKWRRRVEQSAN